MSNHSLPPPAIIRLARPPALVFPLALTLLLGVHHSLGAAEAPVPDDPAPGRGWFAVEGGVGRISLKSGGATGHSTDFYFQAAGGIRASRELLLGLGIGGWLFESYNANDPARGESLTTYSVVSRFYPSPDSGWHLRVNAGPACLVSNDPAVARRRWGTSYDVGVGWERPAGNQRSVWIPSLTFTGGSFGSTRLTGVTLAVAYAWR